MNAGWPVSSAVPMPLVPANSSAQPLDLVVRGDAIQHQAVRRGEHHADCLGREILRHAAQHRSGGVSEGCVRIRVAKVGQFDAVGMDVKIARPMPGVEDVGGHGAGAQSAGREELLTGAFGADGGVGISDHGGCTSVLKSAVPAAYGCSTTAASHFENRGVGLCQNAVDMTFVSD
jgi:hypothetical protein